MIFRPPASRQPAHAGLTRSVCPALPCRLQILDVQPEVFKEKGLSAHGAEIVLLLPSEIDFWYAAHATEPARAPPSVASRGCLLSLRCAQIAQDGRAGPRLWTQQWRLQLCHSFRRGVGPHRGCGCSRTLTPTEASAFAARSAHPSLGLFALDVAGWSAGARTVGQRHAA